MWVYVSPSFMTVYHMLVWCLQMTRGCQVPWDWGYRQLWPAVWVLDIELVLCRAANVLTAEPSFQPPAWTYFKDLCAEWLDSKTKILLRASESLRGLMKEIDWVKAPPPERIKAYLSRCLLWLFTVRTNYHKENLASSAFLFPSATMCLLSLPHVLWLLSHELLPSNLPPHCDRGPY